MNPPKCPAEDYIQWLIASPKVASCTEVARSTQQARPRLTPTHVCLDGLNPSLRSCGLEVENLVQLDSAYLVADDSTLDNHWCELTAGHENIPSHL